MSDTITLNGLTAHRGNVPMLYGRKFSALAIWPSRISVSRGKWWFVIYGDEAPFRACVAFGDYKRVMEFRDGHKTAHSAARWLEAWVRRNHAVFGRIMR